MNMTPVGEIEILPEALLCDPLEWFFAEHHRHRQFCHLVREVASVRVLDRGLVAGLAQFLRHDLGLHVIDEEEDLFPLLRRRAEPEDEIEQVLGVLAAEHRADLAYGESVRQHLEACLARGAPPGLDPEVRKAMLDFADQELRHLALENAVVLPLARRRLSDEDLSAMSGRLSARRGLVLASVHT